MRFAPMLATLARGDWFWIFLLITFAFSAAELWPRSRGWGIASTIAFILFGIIGVALFGWPMK